MQRPAFHKAKPVPFALQAKVDTEIDRLVQRRSTDTCRTERVGFTDSSGEEIERQYQIVW